MWDPRIACELKKFVLKDIIRSKMQYGLWIRQKYEIDIAFPKFDSYM